MNLTDSDRLKSRLLGNKPRDQLIVVYNEYSSVEALTKVEGSKLIIDPALKQEFIQWLKFQQIDDAARDLKISRSSTGRLRQALGLSETYTKNSRTTRWRRGE